jgi:S1-C subfamily serine protease
MTDETRPNEAPDQIPQPAQEAADTAAADQAAAAPPATGPSIAPPPAATWPDATPAQPLPAEQPPTPQPQYFAPPVAGAQPNRGFGAAILAAILAALVVGAFAGLGGGFLGAKLAQQSVNGNSAVSAAGGATGGSTSGEPIVAAAAVAVPSVVNIDITEAAASGGQSGLPSTHPTVPLNGNGSGVAFKAANDGGTYILTNNHVVENANSITVRSPGGQSWPGKVVGRDPDNDIAVVKITGKLPIIQLADPKGFAVGETVVAIGSPYGLEHSVTSGVISAIGRSLSDVSNTGASQPLVDTIQTDAAINPGNSGGALVDRQGHLVGINTAIYSQSGSAAGIGFAIPVDTAINIADQIINTGKVTHPFIGIIGSTITPLIATQQKLPVTRGAIVQDLVKGAGAAQAGVKVNDVVTAVDGVPITSMTDMVAQVRKHTPGQSAELTILRGGQTIKLKVTVSDRPAGMTSSVPATGTK